MQRLITLLFTVLALGCATPALAQSSLSLGVQLNGVGWTGDNSGANGSFSSDKGGQFGLSVSWLKDAFYLGVSLQGGDYQFDNTGPSQFTSAGTVATQDDTVTHADLDLLAGYYFWDQVSLFIDLKGAGSTWDSTNYHQSFSGLGIGVAAYQPVNDKWTLFGSLGFVGGDIKEEDKRKIGDGKSSALILGANLALARQDYLSMGLKLRGFRFDYDDGSDQEYQLNGLFFGYHHVFEL